jgi:alpha-L-fucosidase 2
MDLKKIKFFFTAIGLLFANIISSQELKLWYNKPAEKWTDALPVGNGRIGAMIFGGVEKDRIQFNEETLWTGGPRDYNRTGAYKYLNTTGNYFSRANRRRRRRWRKKNSWV